MFISDIKRPSHLKSRKRVGRGGRRGKTSGRGTKGQKSRSGSVARPRAGFAGGDTTVIKRMPKLRGFKFRARPGARVVNLFTLDKFFRDGEAVNSRTLAAKGLINNQSSVVKILGGGEFKKRLKFESRLSFSESARKKILEAGGKIM